jgi:anti-sigma B factor antagonist
MNLECQNFGRVDLVTLPKQLVMANAPAARNAIKDYVQQGHTRLVLDLQSVDFVDSSGLSVLVSTLKAVQAEKGEVVLLGPSAGVRSLIELTRLHKVFEIFEDRNAAVQRLN